MGCVKDCIGCVLLLSKHLKTFTLITLNLLSLLLDELCLLQEILGTDQVKENDIKKKRNKEKEKRNIRSFSIIICC